MFSVGKGSYCTSSWREDCWGLLDNGWIKIMDSMFSKRPDSRGKVESNKGHSVSSRLHMRVHTHTYVCVHAQTFTIHTQNNKI